MKDGLHIRLAAANSRAYSDWFGIRAMFQPTMPGDFDVSVHYRLATWPVENGTRLTMGSSQFGAVERTSFGQGDGFAHGEYYLTDFWPAGQGPSGFVATSDTVGRLRLTRVGTTYTGYRWNGNEWALINSYIGSTTGTVSDLWLELSSPGLAWGAKDVEAVFETFSIIGTLVRR